MRIDFVRGLRDAVLRTGFTKFAYHHPIAGMTFQLMACIDTTWSKRNHGLSSADRLSSDSVASVSVATPIDVDIDSDSIPSNDGKHG